MKSITHVGPRDNAPTLDASYRPIWSDLRAIPVLTEDAFYGLAGEVVTVIQPHTEADPAALLLSFVTMFGSMVGRSPYAQVGAVRHPAKLFCCCVGDTARSRKGQSFRDACFVLQVADPKLYEKILLSGLSSGEGLIADLASTPDKRRLIFEPEFARVLSIGRREGTTLSRILRDAWDSDALQVLTRKDPLKARNVNVSMIAHITGDELIGMLSHQDATNGFANRFLMGVVRRSKYLPQGGQPLDEVVAHLVPHVRSALDRVRSMASPIVRTPSAETHWADIYCSIPEPPGIVGSLTARAEAHMLRLSLVYALLDGSMVIDVPHVRAAKAVWDYCSTSCAYIFGCTTAQCVDNKLLAGLRDAWPNGLDQTDQSALFARHTSEAQLTAARRRLSEQGLIKIERLATPGRWRGVAYAIPLKIVSTSSDESEACE